MKTAHEYAAELIKRGEFDDDTIEDITRLGPDLFAEVISASALETWADAAIAVCPLYCGAGQPIAEWHYTRLGHVTAGNPDGTARNFHWLHDLAVDCPAAALWDTADRLGIVEPFTAAVAERQGKAPLELVR